MHSPAAPSGRCCTSRPPSHTASTHVTNTIASSRASFPSFHGDVGRAVSEAELRHPLSFHGRRLVAPRALSLTVVPSRIPSARYAPAQPPPPPPSHAHTPPPHLPSQMIESNRELLERGLLNFFVRFSKITADIWQCDGFKSGTQKLVTLSENLRAIDRLCNFDRYIPPGTLFHDGEAPQRTWDRRQSG